ncbi:hypothetical protein CYLTODRAFT_338960, partial [Cylindrobasidium torrendii FP15055 ss-10]
PHLLVELDPDFAKRMKEGYAKDPSLRVYYSETIPQADTVLTPSRYVRGPTGLLYFVDADWHQRLCIPRSMIQEVLTLMHEKPDSAAHEG